MYDFDFDDIDSETWSLRDFPDCPDYQREATIEELLREASDFDTDFYGYEVTICEEDSVYADLLNSLDVEIDETFEGDLE